MTRQTDGLLKLRLRSTQSPFIHHRMQGLAKLGAVLQLPPFAFLGGQPFAGRCSGVFCGLGGERDAELALNRRKLSQQGGERFSASSTGSSLIFCRISEALRASFTEVFMA